MGGNKPSPNPWLADHYPASLLTMGLTAERVARHYGISREDQDAFALASHQKALAAQAAGRFTEELVPVAVTTAVPGAKPGKPVSRGSGIAADEGPRADTSAAALAQLKPAFHAQGRSLPATRRKPPTAPPPPCSWKPRARANLAFAHSPAWSPTPSPAACPKRWASAPSPPSPRRSRLAGLTLNDIGLIELNEAFAAQVAGHHPRALDLDPARINVNGGAIALGHPLGCTGAKLTATLLQEMKAPERPLRHGHNVRRRRHGRRRHL